MRSAEPAIPNPGQQAYPDIIPVGQMRSTWSPSLNLQGDAAEHQAVDLFEQYGIPLGFESSLPAAADLLVEWGQGGHAVRDKGGRAKGRQYRELCRNSGRCAGAPAGTGVARNDCRVSRMEWGEAVIGLPWRRKMVSAMGVPNWIRWQNWQRGCIPGGRGRVDGISRMRMADWWSSLPASR